MAYIGDLLNNSPINLKENPRVHESPTSPSLSPLIPKSQDLPYFNGKVKYLSIERKLISDSLSIEFRVLSQVFPRLLV